MNEMDLEHLKEKLKEFAKIAEEVAKVVDDVFKLQAFSESFKALIATLGVKEIEVPVKTVKSAEIKVSLSEFVAKLNLKSNAERMTALAYYLKQFEGIEEFSLKDLLELWVKVAWRRPGNPNRDLRVAVQKGWISEGKERGRYYITRLGMEHIEGLMRAKEGQ